MVKFLYDHLPAPDPATPTVAAPAPMNLAAVSISLFWTETESGLKIFCWKIIQNIEILYLKTETYRTAVRVASLGAERTTRFMFNFWINLYLLFEIKYKKKFYNEIENIIFLFFLNVFFSLSWLCVKLDWALRQHTKQKAWANGPIRDLFPVKWVKLSDAYLDSQ